MDCLRASFSTLKKGIYLVPVLVLLLASCTANTKKIALYTKIDRRVNALPLKVKTPNNNKASDQKTILGRLLFFDPVLSGNKDVSCATCHHPSNGFAEFRDVSIGVNGTGFGAKRLFNTPNKIPFVKRNAHTILNTAFNGIDSLNNYNPEKSPMFWDMRANSLEEQAIEPIKTMEEMRGLQFSETEILVEVVDRLNAIPEYKVRFKKVFNVEHPITIENIGKAIAAYERTLITNNSRFDKYMRGNDTIMSLSEKEGFKLFKKVGCINCHSGPMFSDFKTHVLSVPENDKITFIDNGFEKQFSFRTPTLRNLRFTKPYMHNGTLPTLEKVLEFYEDLRFKKSRNENIGIHQIDSLAQGLSIKMKDFSLIISFLNTLNDDSFDKTIPDNVPSKLKVGGEIN